MWERQHTTQYERAMCSRTDCYGSAFGEMACAVCSERDMELNERQMKILQRVQCGHTFLNSFNAEDADYRALAENGLIGCENFGHFHPIIFLTDKGAVALGGPAQ